MRRERQAAARNLARVLGVRGWRLRRAVWRQFYAFSRFMVSHCDLGDPDPVALRRWLDDDAGGRSRMLGTLEGGRGLIALTAHLGNWEVGMRLLGLAGAPVHVVMRADRESAAERWLMRRRTGPNLRVVRLDDGPAATLALRAALQRNEIVAMQGDRTIGGRSLTVNLFGAPFGLPSGPFAIASVCEAPLLPVFVVQDGWWRWHAEVGEPIRFPRTTDRDADLRAGAKQYAAALEQAVRRHPDQWFNFYDLWPEEAEA
jgi:KDO2-lipid IV(A) lauroyltransferase